jgi:hypothetical protein
MRSDGVVTEQIEHLILEHLKAIRADIARMDARIDDLVARVTSVEHHVANLLGDVLRMNSRFDQMDARIFRIERRLELAD